MNEKKTYLVSVVIPVYNTERYVRNTITNIIKQTLGFHENIELILINNATTDNSGIVCEEYAKAFPENIKYIVLNDNNGPCGARNEGLKLAQGKYINYLDSDDLWEEDALEKLVDYMEKSNNYVDIVVGRVRHFDGKDKWHVLDWKFEEGHENIIDIQEQYQYIQLHLGSALILTDIAKRYKHDETLFHAEDAKYLNQIILEKRKYALLPSAVFLYRFRPNRESVLQNVNTSKFWYSGTIHNMYIYLMELSCQMYGKVIEYVQYLVMYELQWRISMVATKVISEQERLEYIELIRNLLVNISDDIIWEQKNLWKERKIFALLLKDNSIFLNRIGDEFYYKSINVFSLSEGLYINSIVFFNNRVHIKGFVRYPIKVDFSELLVKDNNDKVYPISFDYDNQDYDVFSLGYNIAHAKTFYYIHSCILSKKLMFYLRIKEKLIRQSIQSFGNTIINKEIILLDKYFIEVKNDI